MNTAYDVSVIIPVKNCSAFLDDCLGSVYEQVYSGSFQVSIYDDDSSDDSLDKAQDWKTKMETKRIGFVLSSGRGGGPRGPGFARNRAIEQSSGTYLCFLDADDVIRPDRIERQFRVVTLNPNAIVGSRFIRTPEGSTKRYSDWANRLNEDQLYLQAYVSHAPTIILPTWFISRRVFNDTGGFDETGLGVPEDLIFFYGHIDRGGTLLRVDDILVTYRYQRSSQTFNVKEDVIWRLRMDVIQRKVLVDWKSFTIWNAGKQGRRFYQSLSEENRKKVAAFCDVDKKKLTVGFYTYENADCLPKPKIPIIHFKKAVPPLIICVKLDMTNNDFENNLASLNLVEGKDYFHFS